MSEDVYKRGKLVPTGKTVEEFDPHTNCFEDDYYETAVVIDGYVFTVESEDVNIYDDIFKASENKDGSIDFELKYYNGGCGFSEAIEYALKNIDK